MKNEHIKYITLNDSRVIASGELDFGGKLIRLCEFDFSEFSTVQRKVIFGWARGRHNVKYSEAFKSTLVSKKNVTFTLDADSQGASINLEGKRINLDLEAMPAGNYTLELKVFLDRPLETLGDVPDHIKPLLHYSEILNVIASFTNSLTPHPHPYFMRDQYMMELVAWAFSWPTWIKWMRSSPKRPALKLSIYKKNFAKLKSQIFYSRRGFLSWFGA